ncbi:MAG: YjbQ family protein [Deltaproteobacteria bacterium]|nr:YjbQ family protein [Deltaproteobacteria bacterium]
MVTRIRVPTRGRGLHEITGPVEAVVDPLYTHTREGPDDVPAHIKAALTATSLSIPVLGGRLALGPWQGVFVWEHRRRGSGRELVLHVAP